MDLKVVREEAIEATTRAFWDRNGFVPDEDSDEWEEEYRRQFEQARKRQATGQPVVVKPSAPPAAPPEGAGWAVLTGAPTQIRWAAALRADRLQEVRDVGVHEWLATTWTKAKSWIDTRDLPTPTFLQRVAPHYAEYRRRADEQARVIEAERQAKAAAAAALQAEIDAAGITVEGRLHAIVHGPCRLRGTEVAIPDIRSGAALVIAALCAEGDSLLRNAWHLDRGYEDMVGKLASVGARIKSVSLDADPSGGHQTYE